MDDPRLRGCPVLLLLRPETNDCFKQLLQGRAWQRIHRATNVDELRQQLSKCRLEGPRDWLVFIDEATIGLSEVERALEQEPTVARGWVVICFTTDPFEGEVRVHPQRPDDLEVHWFRFDDAAATGAFMERLSSAMHDLMVARLASRAAASA